MSTPESRAGVPEMGSDTGSAAEPTTMPSVGRGVQAAKPQRSGQRGVAGVEMPTGPHGAPNAAAHTAASGPACEVEPPGGEQQVTGPAAGDGYDALTAAGEDHAAIVQSLSIIFIRLQELQIEKAPQWDLEGEQRLVIERLLIELVQLRHLVDEMLKNGTNQGPGLGYAASQQAIVIDTETTNASKQWPGSAWDKIKDEVKSALARLWGMISKLIAVKEWTLTGQVGAGIFGLAQPTVSVTFGRYGRVP